MGPNILNNFTASVNNLAASGRPFLFIIDFELEKPLVWPLDELPGDIKFEIQGKIGRGLSLNKPAGKEINIEKYPPGPEEYALAYNKVMENIRHGNSYLLNLTFPTPVKINASLEEIYNMTRAKYRLLYKDMFVVFSPETFVQTEGNTIKTFPMKGTIDAAEENALSQIMNDEKELSEHNTIIDLLRNDLSIVARGVHVKRYRYSDVINTGKGQLIQISSEIRGELPADWHSRLGDILVSMLPAGSVSGAPKKETLRIIREAEPGPRGYYTGVFGVFDGKNLDSSVMIRYIEQTGHKYVYRSGGGITFLSEMEKEYKELISKVYVPVG